MDFSGISKQNAHSGRNVMPRCLSEGVDIFLKSAERQWGKRTRCPRQPIDAMDGVCRRPRHDENRFITFRRKFTPGDATSRRDVPFAVGVCGFFTNSQFSTLPQYQSLPARQLSCLRNRGFCGGMPASNRIRQFRHRLRCYPE